MRVEEIGEFRLIDLLAQTVADAKVGRVEHTGSSGFRVRLAIGDDAAAWDAPEGVRVLTTDTLVEGVHFDFNRTTWGELGWKSLAVNLSDVAAMGCAPLFAVVTLGIRGDLPVDGLVEMYRGMLDASRGHGGAILGGDIVRSPVFFVTIALEGAATAPGRGDSSGPALLRRGAASPGDLIGVTGSLGCSAGGLRMMTEGLVFDSGTSDHLREAHNRPVPRVAQGIALARHGVLSAMDISDGLVDDLGKLCKASQVGAVVHADRVPADETLRGAFPDEWLDLALGGGEDYELLVAAPSNVMDGLDRVLDVPFSIIGDIAEGAAQVTVLDRSGNTMPVERGGWDHFG